MSRKSNAAALKSIVRQYPVTVSGAELWIQKPGLIWLAEKIAGNDALANLMLGASKSNGTEVAEEGVEHAQSGVDIGQIVREFPDFAKTLILKALGEDEDLDSEVAADVRDLGPDELLELAFGVWTITFPDGFGAFQKKVQPLLSKFVAEKDAA